MLKQIDELLVDPWQVGPDCGVIRTPNVKTF
jgi:hypothetical protein